MKSIVCVTEKEYFKAEGVFRDSSEFICIPSPLEEDVLAEAVAGNQAFGVILGVDCYFDKLYTALSRGGIIARFGVGHDGVDKQKATKNGLMVTNTPGTLEDSVAEHAVILMGCLARDICTQDRGMKNKQWQPVIGSELKGKTLLVLGCGAIGRQTAKIASFGFGMQVLGYDIAKLDTDLCKKQYGFAGFVTHPDVGIGRADFVSIHLPATPATKHYVNKQFLAKARHNCCIINTSRGPVIHEGDLYDALESKTIAGAALDVFENEPFEPFSEQKDIRNIDNVILTPHVSGGTREACARMAESCLANIKAAYKKEYEGLNIVNPDVIEKLK